jgi:hypothetical protein
VEYSWLIANEANAVSVEYRRKYSSFWSLNAAMLGDSYKYEYFSLLTDKIATRNSDVFSEGYLRDIALRLYDVPVNGAGKQALQFSFATKLVHMVFPHAPVYDAKIAAFYHFKPLDSDRPVNERITNFLDFYLFLREEHKRILYNGLLESSIKKFRLRFEAESFTDEKIVDSILWAFVGGLEEGALLNLQIVYG